LTRTEAVVTVLPVGHGWAGSVEKFLATPQEDWLAALERHVERLLLRSSSAEQIAAWEDEHVVLPTALTEVTASNPHALEWSLVFEYELPLEGGRRPDVVVLAGAEALVLEFKGTRVIAQAQLDQAAAYARDLADYHEASHHLRVRAYVVATRADPLHGTAQVVTGLQLASLLLGVGAASKQTNLEQWLNAPYAPLPTLVAAARAMFNHETLTHVFAAQSAGVPETVEFVRSLVLRAKHEKERFLVLVAGVPGAGKTLVGLRVVLRAHGELWSSDFLVREPAPCCGLAGCTQEQSLRSRPPRLHTSFCVRRGNDSD
jgi:hypothetical protein